jgi:hypothetical protein
MLLVLPIQLLLILLQQLQCNQKHLVVKEILLLVLEAVLGLLQVIELVVQHQTELVVVEVVWDIMVVAMEEMETAGLVVEVAEVEVPVGPANQVVMQVELLEEMVDQDQRVVE